MAALASTSFDLNNASLVDSVIKDKALLRSKAGKELRVAALIAAESLIFGVFRKECGGGIWVGSAAKRCLKIANGGKAVKARTVTETQIGNVKTEEMQTALGNVRTERTASIAERAEFMRGHNFSDIEVSAYVERATKEAQTNFERAQEWINIAWARIPSAMAIVRTAGDGTVKTQDLERKPVALAFEMVILNRAESAQQFCKAMGY